MNFRSVNDLFSAVRGNLHKFPADIDLVVGIPRSGVLAATAVSLAINRPLTDLNSFLEGRTYEGFSRRQSDVNFELVKKVLIVDDSIYYGTTFREVQRLLKEKITGVEIFACAIFGAEPRYSEVDFILEVCPVPRVFEWNVMNHSSLGISCVDLDGILCLDPTEVENDDGDKYLQFLKNTPRLNMPKYPIHSIVTSRLEKYRSETEQWLSQNKIAYRNLIMLDLPSGAERRRLAIHGKFKAEIYGRSNDCILFIESENWQAKQINELTKKSVLAYRDMIFYGEHVSLLIKKNLQAELRKRLPAWSKSLIKKVIRR